MSKDVNLSRRAILAGATAVPAVAVLPVIGAAAANPDAELIALGVQLDTAGKEWLAFGVLPNGDG
jgi:hypothetical protein